MMMMCSVCHTPKEETEFRLMKKQNRRNSYCKDCERWYMRNYFDSNQLRLRGGSCSGESFGYISVRGEHNHCCRYDLCDDCVVDFFRWVNDSGKLKS